MSIIYSPEVMDKITLTDTIPSPSTLNTPKITNPVPTYKPTDFQTSLSESSVGGSDTVATTTMSIEGKNELNKSGVGNNKLASSMDKKENFAEYMSFSKDAPTDMNMTTNLKDTNLQKNWTTMVEDKPKKYDFSSNVIDPNGYGYVASLDEVRNKDAVDLYQQEHATFAIGAIAGVSLIVLGILMAASSNGNSS